MSGATRLSSPGSEDRALDEWKEARSVIARFENNLHDLRKYGFTFVTALLAADGLLSQGGNTVVPPGVKAGVLVTTMGLIVTLKLLDTHYGLFQKAASIRGRLLEDRLNLDITSDLSMFYELEHWRAYVQALYYGFVGLTVLVGFAILESDRRLVALTLVAGAASGLLINFVSKEKQTGLEDWSVDKKIVSQGTPVRITFTNLDPKDCDNPGPFRVSWNVKSELAMAATGQVWEASPVEAQLEYFESHDWLWETEEAKPDLYELAMFSVRKRTTASSTTAGSVDTSSVGKPSSKLTIQVTPKVKQETPVRAVLEKTGTS